MPAAGISAPVGLWPPLEEKLAASGWPVVDCSQGLYLFSEEMRWAEGVLLSGGVYASLSLTLVSHCVLKSLFRSTASIISSV